MTYETIDWEAESKLISSAFEVLHPCIWDKRGYPETSYLVPKHNPSAHVVTKDGYLLSASYTDRDTGLSRHFALLKPDLVGTYISIDENGTIRASDNHINSLPIAKSLFHLCLLTAKAESALGVTISAHQKTEWVIDYAAR